MPIIKQINRRHYLFFSWLYLCLIFAGLLFKPNTVLAQNTNNPADVSAMYGLDQNFNVGVGQTTDLKTIVANVINIILGLLGIIAVLIISLGGFKWMTAAGNEDQVAQARRMIVDGVIGLVVIFAAWGISSFVINQLANITGATAVPSSAGNQASQSPPSSSFANLSSDSLAGGLSSTSLPQEGDANSNQAGNNQNIDSDGDGLSDWQENNIYHTSPSKPDTDNDGFTDGQEASGGYSPTGDGKITDSKNNQNCASFMSLLASALGSPSALASAQTQIKNCCAQFQDPLCSGL